MERGKSLLYATSRRMRVHICPSQENQSDEGAETFVVVISTHESSPCVPTFVIAKLDNRRVVRSSAALEQHEKCGAWWLSSPSLCHAGEAFNFCI